MPKISIKKGSTSKSVGILIQDATKSDGSGLVGLVYNSSNLIAYWYQPGVTGPAAISLVNLSTITSTYSSGGFKEVDNTHMKGHYRFDIPNACLTGANDVIIELSGAVDMVPCRLEIELTATDNQDAINGGMSALPHTAITTNASLITSGTGADQLTLSSGKVILQTSQPGVTIPTVTTLTNQLTPAQIATGVWQDTVSGDFTVPSSIGKFLYDSATGGVSQYFNDITRPNGDTNSIFIQWINSSATITATKSFNGGSYTAITGAINYLRLDGTAYIYEFTYNSADRPTSGSVVYKFTDGTLTRFLILEVAHNVIVGGYASGQDPATLVLGATASSWDTVLTIGHAINAAGTAADPWTAALPGAYSSGTAGYIIGHFASATDPWSVTLPGAFGSGTAGYIIGHFAASADPWDITIPGSYSSGKAGNILGNLITSLFATNLPGSYTGGQAGYIIGQNLDNRISSRPSASEVAAAVWQDTISGHFTVSNSIGKSLYTGIVPGNSGGLALQGGTVIISGYSSGQDPATLILGATAASWNSSGTIGHLINLITTSDPWLVELPGDYNPGTAGYIVGNSINETDPWATVLPASYASNQAGYIVGHNLNATISSRLASGSVTVGNYSSGFDPATLVLGALATDWDTAGTIGFYIGSVVSNTLTTTDIWQDLLDSGDFDVGNSVGAVIKNIIVSGAGIDMGQAVPMIYTGNTVGDCLNAARVQAFGEWVIDRNAKILTLYNYNNSIAFQFDLDSVVAPTQRTIH